MTRSTHCSFLIPCLGFALFACGDDAQRERDGAPADATSDIDSSEEVAADTAVPPDTTPVDTAPADTTPADTAPADTGAETDVVAATCAADDLEACFYPSRDVPYVTREGLSVEDATTGRSLPLLARIPAVAGPVPVVIWMHGGGFNDNGHRTSETWGDTLARHGFLVIHVASSSLTADAARTMCALASVPEAECVAGDDEDASGLLAVFRTFDLVAVLDDLPRLSTISVNNGGPALDLERVAVGGWSGGSRAPLMVMGATVKTTASGPLFSKPHARPAAAFTMSQAGPGFGGFYDDGDTTSWSALRGPMFMATGTNDQKPLKPELTGLIRRFPFEAQPADGQRLLLYSNLAVGLGGHSTYNLEDLDSADERVRRLSLAISSATRAFLDAALRGDADALAWLASGNARVLAGDVDWLRR